MSNWKDKVVITCAITGALANRKQAEGIPYRPEEYGEEAKRAYDAGAAVVHVHAREEDGTPSMRPEMYRRERDEIRKRSPIILNFSTGAIGIPPEQRIAHIRELQPDIGALNMGSVNYLKYSENRKSFVWDFTFQNNMNEVTFFLTEMNKAGVKPECECFDTGHVVNSHHLIHMGILKAPPDYSLILGSGGIAPEPEDLMHIVRKLPPGATWKTIPVSHATWRLTAQAIVMGGNIRVGFEDNFYLPNGNKARSNGELVEAAANLARVIGREVASVDEARQILGLPARSASSAASAA
ncbi:MAG: 3-keto-5-aminohexanoate cleavage protein [Nitrospirae bacterium]|nr:3-keto-5-aminohexanoate cleavage protein [Nitrospirota bacterium]